MGKPDHNIVLTVVNHKPRKYLMWGQEASPSMSDQLERIAWTYFFNEIPHGDHNFTVKVTSDLIRFYFKGHENQMHFETVRYALREVRKNPDVKELQFETDHYESREKEPILTGSELEYPILSFFCDVNSELPQEPISIFHLWQNFPVRFDELKNWTRTLYDDGYLEIANEIANRHVKVLSHEGITGSQAYSAVHAKLPDLRNMIRQHEQEKELANESQDVPSEQKFDVALSYASEDRNYVCSVAESLKRSDISVFYDEYEQIRNWGRTPAIVLDEVYRKRSKYVVIFISKHYAEKMWTIVELKAALTRAAAEKQEYVLPARFDDTELPGISRETHFHIDLRGRSPEQFAQDIVDKVRGASTELS